MWRSTTAARADHGGTRSLAAPPHFEHHATLRDGTPVLLRPIRADDKWRLKEGLQQLSPHSRYLRFHAPVEHLTTEQLRYLTEVDYRRHMALVALNPDRPDEPGMGVARYVCLADDPTTAEAAVTVADRYQGRGLGSLLVQELTRYATTHGVTTFRNYVLSENAAMLDILQEAGGRREDLGGGVVQVDVPLAPDTAVDDDTGPLRVLRGIAGGDFPAVHWRFPWHVFLRHGPRARERAKGGDEPQQPGAPSE